MGAVNNRFGYVCPGHLQYRPLCSSSSIQRRNGIGQRSTCRIGPHHVIGFSAYLIDARRDEIVRFPMRNSGVNDAEPDRTSAPKSLPRARGICRTDCAGASRVVARGDYPRIRPGQSQLLRLPSNRTLSESPISPLCGPQKPARCLQLLSPSTDIPAVVERAHHSDEHSPDDELSLPLIRPFRPHSGSCRWRRVPFAETCKQPGYGWWLPSSA
jgi:hypothetical protein